MAEMSQAFVCSVFLHDYYFALCHGKYLVIIDLKINILVNIIVNFFFALCHYSLIKIRTSNRFLDDPRDVPKSEERLEVLILIRLSVINAVC